jgi:hypothetical protein
MSPEQAKIDVIGWMVNFVEKPNPLLNNWAPCPYARQARINGQVSVDVGTNPAVDLANIANTSWPDTKEVAVLIYDPVEWDLKKFRSAWQPAQDKLLAPLGLFVLEDHPEDTETVKGVSMNQGTWAILFVQRLLKLQEAASQLATKGYYNDWPEEYLKDLFHGRLDPRP